MTDLPVQEVASKDKNSILNTLKKQNFTVGYLFIIFIYKCIQIHLNDYLLFLCYRCATFSFEIAPINENFAGVCKYAPTSPLLLLVL